MGKITVYTTDPCSFCARLKGLLSKRGLTYEEVNLSRDPEGRAELARRTGMMTFPQVLVGERVVGGFAETLSAVESGALQDLLAAEASTVSTAVSSPSTAPSPASTSTSTASTSSASTALA